MPGSPPPTLQELLQFLYLSPVGVIKFHGDGTVDLINPVASALLMSISPAETLQNVYTALAPLAPDLRQLVAHFTGPAGILVDQNWVPVAAGGEIKVMSLTVHQIDGDVYMAAVADVSKLALQERKLSADRQKFFAIFDYVRDYAIYTLTKDGSFDEWNQSLQRFAGWLATDLQGQTLAMFFPADDPEQPQLESLLAEAERLGSVQTEGWRLKRDGSRLWAASVISPLTDESGTVCGFVVVSRDITDRKRLEDDSRLLATTDSLTGAYNRRKGDAMIAAEYNRRSRDGRTFAIMLVDVDHFKAINDRYGHPAGDAVLCALVKMCQRTLRTTDMVIRWGGDEFLLLLRDSDATAATAAARRICTALAATEIAQPEAGPIRFTVSIGIALPTSELASDLIAQADTALYAAKNAGRNQAALAPPQTAPAAEKRHAEIVTPLY